MGKFKDYKRKSVVAINIILVIFGIIITAYGVSANNAAQRYSNVALLTLLDLSLIGDLIIFAGIITLFVSLSGFLGAYFKFRKALMFYIVAFWIISIALIAFGKYLSDKTAEDLRPSWETSTAVANDNRLQFMQVFACCGFDRNTDSYQLQSCHIDLNTYPNTLPCSAAMRTFLENEVYPVATSAIVLGAFELLAIVVTMGIIFTEKEMKEEFYENPFHG